MWNRSENLNLKYIQCTDYFLMKCYIDGFHQNQLMVYGLQLLTSLSDALS